MDDGDHGPRGRILAATTKLLADGGREAVSTRAVGAAGGVEAPTIYRLFGDMQGLLDAVASDGFTTYLTSKPSPDLSADPVDDLRAGWDLHVGFGLANPALYLLMYEPRRGAATSPAAIAGEQILAARVHRIAEAGRLRVGEERATHLVHAGGHGAALTLISLPANRRDPELSMLAREAIVAAITTDAAPAVPPGPVDAAITLRAVLPQTTALTDPEQRLLTEWLDRIADQPASRGLVVVPEPAH